MSPENLPSEYLSPSHFPQKLLDHTVQIFQEEKTETVWIPTVSAIDFSSACFLVLKEPKQYAFYCKVSQEQSTW